MRTNLFETITNIYKTNENAWVTYTHNNGYGFSAMMAKDFFEEFTTEEMLDATVLTVEKIDNNYNLVVRF